MTTRSIQAYVACGNGSGCGVIGPDGAERASGSTWNLLVHDRLHGFRGHSSDGWNHVYANSSRWTPELTVGAPACSMSGGGTAPGAASITARGGSGAGWYEYSPSQYRSGLGAGTYGGAARSGRSDGYNSVVSGWAACDNSVTVTAPVPAVVTGLSYYFDGSASRIKFNPSPGATSYLLVEQGYIDGGWRTLITETVTSTSLSGIHAAGSSYSAGRVRVQAQGPGGISAWSAFAQIGTPN